MRACVVHSVDIDSSDAAAELISGAKLALGEALPRVGMLFAGIDHDFELVLEQINAQWPGIALIGCSTDGEMSSQILFAEDSLALVLLSGEDFHAVSGVARSVSTDVAGSIRASAACPPARPGERARWGRTCCERTGSKLTGDRD